MRRLGGDYEANLSREELETILQEIVTGIAIVSPHPDGVRLDYTNNGFFQIFGYTREEYESLGDAVRLNLFHERDFMNIVTKINTDYAPGEVLQFECRINKKGGEQAWGLISTRKPSNAAQGEQTFICSIVDITDLKKIQLNQEKERKRYEIIEELSDNIFFTYDVTNDVFEASAKILRSIGTRTRIENAIESMTYGDIIDHRDVPAFIGALSNGLSGQRKNTFDARIINNRGDSVWHRIKFSVVFDENDNAVQFVGNMTDIDKEKKEKNRLIAQAETDQLTGFLNKLSTMLKVNELIKEEEEEGALFIFDIDNFKKLNDTYGHRVGDIFLKEFTGKLSLSFRTSDVLGRVGGEEFVLYLSGVGDNKHYLEEKAVQIQSICNSIRLEVAPEEEFSCSIGISRFPSDGKTYTELYEKADKAMYYVKNHGKKNFAFIDEIG
ncbi:MAG: GGDEF domain-containing protein [Clostridia bacterium]|nr:GGDEF domain-containing protein [Clostridia bacterium]